MNLADILWDFDAELRDGRNPQVETYLPRLAEVSGRLELLVELVRCELSYRQGTPGILEKHLARFDDLRSSHDHVAKLIIQEYRARLQSGANPTREEYLQRFPAYADAISSHWEEAAQTSCGDTPGPAADPFATNEPSTQSQSSLPSVPGYVILGELGRGGMGVVYKARHIRLKRIVALKMILVGAHAGTEHLERFRTEAEAVARFQHPNIVQIHEVSEHNGLPYIALEFVEGGNLAKKLRRNPQAFQEAARVVETLARVMHAAHQKGVIHRDLKPVNVLLTADGTPKITDFGLAKKLDVEGGQTYTGAVMGTPSYMAPEQAAGKTKEIGPLTDVYALGAILYEMLTGRPPFQGDSVLEILDQVRNQEAVPASQLRPKMPRDLDTICVKCLQKGPGKRSDNAEALADDLRRFQNGEPILARPVGRVERTWRWCRRRPAMASLLVMVILAFAGLAAAVEQGYEKLEADFRVEQKDKERLAAKDRQQAAELGQTKEKLNALRSKSLPLLQKAAVARAEGFHQAEALYLAKALSYYDDPETRSQWLLARQRSLVPLESSSRRLLTGALAYSADGKLFVSGGRLDGQIRVWKTDTWSQQFVLSGHNKPSAETESTWECREIVFRPDKLNEIVSVGSDGTVQVWEVATGKRLDRYPPEGKDPGPGQRSVAIEPLSGPGSRPRMLTGDEKGTLTWWLLDPIEIISQKEEVHAGRVSRVRYRPDGQQSASVGDDGLVKLWDPAGKSIGTLDLPDRRRRQVQLLSVGSLGAGPFLSPLSTLSFLPAFHLKPEVLPLQREMYALAYSPDNRHLAVGGKDGRIYVWDVTDPTNHRLLLSMEGHQPADDGERWITTLAYSSSDRLFSGGWDGTIREWDTRNGKQVGICGRHKTHVLGNSQITAMALRPGTEEIISSGADCTIRVWDRTGKSLAKLEGGPVLPSPDLPLGLAVSAYCAKEHVLVTSNALADAFLRSWDTRTLHELRTYGGLAHNGGYDWNKRVSALAIQPDGGQFVSAEPNGDLVWWDTKTGKQDRKPSVHKSFPPQKLTNLAWWTGQHQNIVNTAKDGAYSWLAVGALAWSHDGKSVASAGIDGTLQLWDAKSHQSLGPPWKEKEPGTVFLPFPAAGVGPAAQMNVTRFFNALGGTLELPRSMLLFDHTDSQLIAAGGDNDIRAWNLDPGKPHVVYKLSGHAMRVNALALSGKEHKLLASGSEDGFVVIWDLEKRRILRMTSLKPLRAPDPKRFQADKPDSALSEQLEGIREKYAAVRSLAFSPDERWLAVTLVDGSVSLLDVATGNATYRGVGHEVDGMSISAVTAYFTREGELLTVGGDQTVRHWNLPAWATGRQMLVPDMFTGQESISRFWEQKGCVICRAGSIMQWSPAKAQLQMERKGWQAAGPGKVTKDSAETIASGRADGKVVVATMFGHVLVLDVKTGKSVVEFTGPPNAKRVFPPLPIVQITRLLQAVPPPRPIEAVAVHPRDPLAASAWSDGSVDIWNLNDGKWLRTLKGGRGKVVALAFKPDSHQLAATYHDDKDLHLYDADSGKLLTKVSGGPRLAMGLCYSPDGTRLIQAGMGPSIVIWNPATRQRVGTIETKPPLTSFLGVKVPQIRNATYSPDGDWLATGDFYGTIRLYDGKTFKPLAVLSVLTIKSKSAWASIAGAPLGPVGLGMSAGHEIISSLTFTGDRSQLVSVRIDGDVRVFDLPPIKDILKTSKEDLLKVTEAETGLRLLEYQNAAEIGMEPRLAEYKPVSLEQIRLARPGVTLRPAYEQDFSDVLARVSRAHSLRSAEERDLLERLLQEPGVTPSQEEITRTSLASICLILGLDSNAEAEYRKVLVRMALPLVPHRLTARPVIFARVLWATPAGGRLSAIGARAVSFIGPPKGMAAAWQAGTRRWWWASP